MDWDVNENVYIHGCHDGANQKWYAYGSHEGGTKIRNGQMKDGRWYCLRECCGYKVYAHPCDDNNSGYGWHTPANFFAR